MPCCPTACGEEGSSRSASAREIRALAPRARRSREVNLNSILLSLLGWGLGFLLVVVLLRIGARDHAARRQRSRNPAVGATTSQTDNRATDRR